MGNSTRFEKESLLAPHHAKNSELARDLAAKQRQIQILPKEVATPGTQVAQLQAEAVQQNDKALKAQAAAGAELAFREARIRHLEAQLEEQAALHQQAEKRLSDRCRLLQAW